MQYAKKRGRRHHVIVYSLVIVFFAAIMLLDSSTVFAKRQWYKNKTFTIYNLGPNTYVDIIAVDDNTGTQVGNWFLGGTISYSLNSQGDGFNSLTVVMSNVDVTDWTPYIRIRTSRPGYTPIGWIGGNWGGTGCDCPQQVHNLTDEWHNGVCLFYIGVGFGYDQIYCDWRQEHVVHYDANGGSGAPGDQTKVYGSILTLSNQIPSRAGHTFTGWNTASNGSGRAYSPGEWYGEDASVTLYAQWKANNYTQYFNHYKKNPTTGQYEFVEQTSQNLPWGTTVHVKYNTYVGYHGSSFTVNSWNGVNGWNYCGTNISYVVNNAYCCNVYYDPNSYVVVYNGNGATSGSMGADTFLFGKAYNLKDNTYKKQYTVSYDAGGGICSISKNVADATFNGWQDNNTMYYQGMYFNYFGFDAPYYVNKYSDIKRTWGYNKYATFEHWYMSTVQGKETRQSAKNFKIDDYIKYGGSDLKAAFGSNRLAYVSHWMSYGIYEGRKGVASIDSATSDLYPKRAGVANLSAVNGETVTLHADWTNGRVTLPKPSREGYEFLGWYTNTGTYIGKAGETYTPTSNIKLVAKWKDVTAPAIEDESDNPIIKKTETEIEYDWVNKDVTLKFSATDLGSGMKSLVLKEAASGTKLSTGIDSVEYTLNKDDYQGVNKFIVEATDKANPANTGTLYVTVRIDITNPEYSTINNSDFTNSSDFTKKIISTHASDYGTNPEQSGMKKIVLEKKVDSSWVTSNTIIVSDTSGCKETTKEFEVEINDYKYKHRILYYDYAGNVSTSEEFYIMPITLKADIGKIGQNGLEMGGGSINFIQGGDMNATISVDLTGYVESVTYTFDENLNHAEETHMIPLEQTSNVDGKGKASDTISFLVPEGLELGKKYNIIVTGRRGELTVSQTVSIEVNDVNYGDLQNQIRTQSGIKKRNE